MTDRAVSAALEALDTENCVRWAQELIRIPSVTGDERVVQERVGAIMEDSGLEVDSFEADLGRLRSLPDFPGMEVERNDAVLVAGAIGNRGDRSLILNGHVDVVPPGELSGWDASPWSGEIAEGRLFGRGAADMKAGLAVALAAAAAIRRSGLQLRGRLVVQSVVGEEDGGIGTFAMIDRGYRADAAVILEPTRLCLIPAQAGALSFRVHLTGRAAHASVRYKGVSSIDKYQTIGRVLRRIERQLNQHPHHLFLRYPIPYALSVGKLRSGSWSAMVPDHLECEGRIGVPIGMPSAAVRDQLEAGIANAARRDGWLRDHPPKVEWFGGQFDPAQVDPDIEAFRAVRAAHASEFGSEPPLDGAPYGSDMRLFINKGRIPAILYGPGDISQAHYTNEWVSIDQIVGAARVITAAAARYLSA